VTVKELIAQLERISVPAEVFFPNMEIATLEPVQRVSLHDKGNYGWMKPEFRYKVVLS
jgi:hypothetical protein